MSDEHSPLRPLLVQLLAFTGKREGLRHLMELLATGDLETKTLVVETLQEIHDMRFGALFLPFVADPESAIRRSAAQSVSTFGQAEARLILPPLIAMRDERMAIAAIQALTLTRMEGARETLSSRLGVESRPGVQQAIRDAVGSLSS
jgi:HEAT repeat protein